MRLEPGTRIGPYEIVAPIGAGGMGEVYRARDGRLNRDVAIKVLPAAVAADSERLSRFVREAQVLASLNHPGIGSIYGIEDAAGTKALVLELIEGPTLDARIASGPLPIDETVSIASQIADALETAHEQGIVHRDLKPANIKVRPDGTVKILDFGLAKALDPAAPAAVDATRSPTITAVATKQGVILGTAAYMAPEQAKGKPVDKRADIWAFGVVLYEMLTGRRPFEGETPSETLAAVILKDPDLPGIPEGTPPALRRLLVRCLEKDPKRRLRDIGEARLVLSGPLAAEEPKAAPAAPVGGTVTATAATIRWAVWTSAALALGLVASIAMLWRAWRPVDQTVARYDIAVPAKSSLVLASRPSVAISRDGSTLAFVATSDGIARLYARRRTDAEARAIDGAEGASNPVFSPDGRWIAFFADNQLKKVAIDGPVSSLAPVNDPRGLAWSDDGQLVYTPEATGPIYAISVNGGAPKPVTTLDTGRDERTHRWPEVLPGGKVVLFTVGVVASPDSYDSSDIDAVVVSTGERRTILKGASMVRYLPPRRLVFARAGTLNAAEFDPDTLTLKGTPVTVMQGLSGDAPTGAAHFTCSE